MIYDFGPNFSWLKLLGEAERARSTRLLFKISFIINKIRYVNDTVLLCDNLQKPSASSKLCQRRMSLTQFACKWQ